jgi:hypothetical protein
MTFNFEATRTSEPLIPYRAVNELYKEFSAVVKQMPLKFRSGLIKLCQAQRVPTPAERGPLLSIIDSLPASWMHPGLQASTPLGLSTRYKTLIESPVFSALTLDLLRSLPLDVEQIKQGFSDSIWKEIECCEGVETRRHQINWAPFFRPESRGESVLPGLPPNPYMSLFIYNRLCDWRIRACKKIHFPRASWKTMAHTTFREYADIRRKAFVIDEDMPLQFSQHHWLRFYHETGIRLAGASEMRVKWYPSQAKPRTYYAMGGEAYQYCLYLQDTFTDMVNGNRMTHHVTRLQPSLVRLKLGQHLKIYDFTSFTSRMDNQKEFIDWLADFCFGHPFTYFDPREGPCTTDFGDMLSTYRDICCSKPTVSYDRVAKRLGIDRFGPHIAVHNVASFLGVFGNLMSCTFAHAAVVSQAVDDEDQNATAGDDGAIAEDSSNEHYIECAACSIGIFEPTKNFSTDIPPCIALKRPISQIPGTTVLEVGTMIVPPSYRLISQVFGHSSFDPRYQSYEDLSRETLCNKLGKALFRYIRSVYFQSSKLSYDDLETAIFFAHAVSDGAKRCGFDVDSEGRLPLCGHGNIFWPTVCADVESFLSVDPSQALVNRWYEGFIIVSRRGTDNHSYPHSLGENALCNSSRWMTLMVSLGYLEAEIEREVLTGIAGYNWLIRYFTDPIPIVYKVTCIRDIPFHLNYPR